MSRRTRPVTKRGFRSLPHLDADLTTSYRSLVGGLALLEDQDDCVGRTNGKKGRAKAAATTSITHRVVLLPRNDAQYDYVDALGDRNNHVVIAIGPAGTGKTMLATQHAVQGYQDGIYDKIILTRPQVSVDEQLGFLPGNLVEKCQPWCIPILDVLKETWDAKRISRMIEDETIEIAPLGFMRGRTLKRAVVLFDEAQNSTPNQMKMMLTRIGDGSRMIVTGDVRQHDRGYEDNGLKDFISRLDGTSSSIAVVHFDAGDVERHEVVREVLGLYGEA